MPTYTLQGKTVNRAGVDGVRYQHTYPDRTFKSAMEMLHWATKTRLIRHQVGGWTPTPLSIYLGSESDAHRGYRCTGDGGQYKITNEDREAMKRAQERAKQLAHHFAEIEPQWQDLGKVYYADNSVVMQQQDKTGRRREVTLTSPHGDLCF